jgi:hypothetical protein
MSLTGSSLFFAFLLAFDFALLIINSPDKQMLPLMKRDWQ